MKILILSFYFKPDLSAGAFRASSLVDALKEMMPNHWQVDVLTTLPNRYKSFKVESSTEETLEGQSIFRVDLPKCRQSGMVEQVIAFITYTRRVLLQTREQHYDLVFATSSRLMTAALGAWVASQNRTMLYLDIRDIFVDTIKDVLPRPLAILMKPLFTFLEGWTINNAIKVNLVSKGFAKYFATRYPNQRFSYYTNGIDDEFLSLPRATSTKKSNHMLEVLYAGNLGEGQGLHLIIPALAKMMDGKIRFKVIGDGGRKEALSKALISLGADNVVLLPPMKRAQLLSAYQMADVLFLHLNDYDAFKKVLPSKIFEYGATGKPIWAGVSGYAADFIRENINNAAVFSPCDANEALTSFATLSMVMLPRDNFVKNFGRQVIMRKMAKDIIDLAEKDN